PGLAPELVAQPPLLPYRLDRPLVLALCLWRLLLLRAVALGLLVVRSVLGLRLWRHLPGRLLPLQLRQLRAGTSRPGTYGAAQARHSPGLQRGSRRSYRLADRSDPVRGTARSAAGPVARRSR